MYKSIIKNYNYSCSSRPNFDCGCIATINSKCIDYYGDALNSIGVPVNTHTTLEKIIQEIDGYLQNLGPSNEAITSVSGDTILDNTYGTVIVNVSSSLVTVTLPAAVGNTGKKITIKKNGASNSININTLGGNIDGVSMVSMGCAGGARTFQSDGTDWWIIGSYDSGC